MKIEQISKIDFEQALKNSTSIKELSKKLGISIRRERHYEYIKNVFGIDINNCIQMNVKRKRENEMEKRLNVEYICDNPNCRKKFKLKEHNVVSKNGRRYCSYKCGHEVSSNSNKIERYEKVSKKLKMKQHKIRCMICNCELTVNAIVNKKICDSCKNNLFLLNRNRYKNINVVIHKYYPLQRCKICGAQKKCCKHPEICSKRMAFPRMIRYLGFDSNTIGSEEVYEEFYRVKQYVNDLYWNKEMSISEIKELCGYPYSTGNFSKLLLIFTKFRTVKDALLISKKNNIESFFNSGIHKTWDGKTVFYRSSYELDFCNELDKQQIEYEMENLTIDYYDTELKKYRFAIPDFYIPSTNTIIEVKSKFTFKKQNMIDRALAFIKNGYKFGLLLEHKMYNGLDFIDNTIESDKTIYDYGEVAELANAAPC